MRSRASRLVLSVATLAVGLGLAVHAAYIDRAGANAVYMDTLRLLWQWSEFRDGNLSLLALWGQGGGAHSGLLFQSVLAANVSWFGLDPLLANRSTGVVMAVVALLLLASYAIDLRRSDRNVPVLSQVMVILAVAGLCFSLAGFELMTLDLGLGLWLKNLLIFVLFLAHAETLRRGKVPSLTTSFALAGYGVFVILFCAMGWSYAVIGAIVGVQLLHHLSVRRWPDVRQALLPLALLGGQLAVTLGKRMHFGHADEANVTIGADTLRQWLLSLSSTFVNAEAAAKLGLSTHLLMALGGLLAIGFALATVLRLRDRSASLMPLHLIAYASLCALSFVVARGALGDDAVMASRYHMDVLPGFVGLLWVVSMSGRSGEASRRNSFGAVAVLFLMLAVFQARQASIEWATAPYRKVSFVAINELLQAGVPDQKAADLLQAPIEDARRAVDVMRRDRLAVFRGSPGLSADEGSCSREWRAGEGWYAQEGSGRWSSARAVFELAACACAYRIELFIPEGHAPRTVTVSTTSGDARPTARLELAPGLFTVLRLPEASEARQYRLVSSRTTIPAELGINQDVRALGVYMGPAHADCAVAK